jgi:hypothetical protein
MSATAFTAVAALFVVSSSKYQKARLFIHVIVFGAKTGALLKRNKNFIVVH